MARRPGFSLKRIQTSEELIEEFNKLKDEGINLSQVEMNIWIAEFSERFRQLREQECSVQHLVGGEPAVEKKTLESSSVRTTTPAQEAQGFEAQNDEGVLLEEDEESKHPVAEQGHTLEFETFDLLGLDPAYAYEPFDLLGPITDSTCKSFSLLDPNIDSADSFSAKYDSMCESEDGGAVNKSGYEAAYDSHHLLDSGSALCSS